MQMQMPVCTICRSERARAITDSTGNRVRGKRRVGPRDPLSEMIPSFFPFFRNLLLSYARTGTFVHVACRDNRHNDRRDRI